MSVCPVSKWKRGKGKRVGSRINTGKKTKRKPQMAPTMIKTMDRNKKRWKDDPMKDTTTPRASTKRQIVSNT